MSKKHDENRDLRSVSRIGKISLGDRCISISKTAKVGIHMLGKLDYLTKYCGWHVVWVNGNQFISMSETETATEHAGSKAARILKKQAKEPKLQNKNSKSSRKK